MAGPNELNSFVSKFFSLWSNGLEADLHVRCHNGYSFINLQTGLGYAKYDTGKYSPRRKKVKLVMMILGKLLIIVVMILLWKIPHMRIKLTMVAKM